MRINEFIGQGSADADFKTSVPIDMKTDKVTDKVTDVCENAVFKKVSGTEIKMNK